MRRIISGCLLAILGLSSFGHAQADSTFDWKQWQFLPVQDGGRSKPLDSLAWEMFRMVSNRAGYTDPGTGDRLDAVALYLTLYFSRQPAGQLNGQHVPPIAAHGQPADQWDSAPLLRVDYLELRDALGMTADEKHISPVELGEAKIRDPHTGKEALFLAWAQKLARSGDGRSLTTFERKGVELSEAFRAYHEHRSGKRLGVAPIEGSEDEEWMSLADLSRTAFDDTSDSSGRLREAQEHLQAARAAFVAGSADEFNEASARFIVTLKEAGPQLGDYPMENSIRLEVAYNHWMPFRFAWVLTTIACLGGLISSGVRSRTVYVGSMTAFVLGFVAMAIGFGMRTAISGRAPVTNMYESVVYLALGTAVLGLIFELMYRKRFILIAASFVTTAALVLADNCPAVLDPSLRPLQPVLRNNFWLVTHVMSITLSYAAFALALGIGNITLGYFMFRSRNRETIAALTQFTYRSLQVGVLLLAIGTFLGGVWAAYSWGRFWGWDPKEVWALIALLAYLAVLHARFAGWVGDRGLAALSVTCFALVVMAWYGVNFVLGAGLHSYGFGGGGQGYVLIAIGAQFLYVLVALSVPSHAAIVSQDASQTHADSTAAHKAA